MRLTDRVERYFIFRMARAVFLVLAILAVIAIVADLAAIYMEHPIRTAASDQTMTAASILGKIPTSESSYDQPLASSGSGVMRNADGLLIPKALNADLRNDEEGKPIVDTWLGSVPPGERQSFLNGLSQVVALASQRADAWEWDNRQRYVDAAMDRYAHLKIDYLKRVRNAQAATAERNQRYMALAGALLGAMTLFTLILVLLAIERNTRSALGSAT